MINHQPRHPVTWQNTTGRGTDVLELRGEPGRQALQNMTIEQGEAGKGETTTPTVADGAVLDPTAITINGARADKRRRARARKAIGEESSTAESGHKATGRGEGNHSSGDHCQHHTRFNCSHNNWPSRGEETPGEDQEEPEEEEDAIASRIGKGRKANRRHNTAAGEPERQPGTRVTTHHNLDDSRRLHGSRGRHNYSDGAKIISGEWWTLR